MIVILNSLYFVLDNTGSEDTEDERLTVSYQNANLFDRDHTLTASFTTAPADTDKASQFGVNYRIPLYLAWGLAGFSGVGVRGRFWRSCR